MPPATIGMDAVSVVFICHGAPPSLGAAVPAASRATVSTTLTTKSTKMLLLRAGEGYLIVKNLEPKRDVEGHELVGDSVRAADLGPQSWPTISLKSLTSPSKLYRPKVASSV
eukprot:3901655-Rhodomonas_salina.1